LTQDRIVANVSQKMDSFFEEAEYNWTTAQPPATAEASGYLQDLIDFLSTVMMSVLIQLPEFSKDYVYRGALSHCAMVLTVSVSCEACANVRELMSRIFLASRTCLIAIPSASATAGSYT
jgi:hypothetical protein